MLKLYTKNRCVQCRQVKRVLVEAGIPFDEIFVDEQPGIIDKLIREGYKAVPVLKSDTETITGYSPDALNAFLTRFHAQNG